MGGPFQIGRGRRGVGVTGKWERSMGKPRIFIGSSAEGKAIAEQIQLGLDYDAECTIWWQWVRSGSPPARLRA